MRAGRLLLLFVKTSLLAYVVLAFIAWDLNPIHWGAAARATLVLIGAGIAIPLWAFSRGLRYRK